MVVRTTAWPQGTPCWVDMSTDVDCAIAFYGGLLGWTFDEGSPETGGYRLARKDGHLVGGVAPKQSPDQPNQWTTYLATDDVDTSASRVSAAGGTVAFPPMDVTEQGRMCLATDPTGAFFGLWQSGTTTGFNLANEPGSVVWNEHMSPRPAAARDFYAALFPYTYDAVEGAEDYSTIAVPDAEIPVGGLGLNDSRAPEAGAHWSVYFAVADADAAVQKVGRLGGQVLSAPVDTPFGRLAHVTDDQGARFYAMQPPV